MLSHTHTIVPAYTRTTLTVCECRPCQQRAYFWQTKSLPRGYVMFMHVCICMAKADKEGMSHVCMCIIYANGGQKDPSMRVYNVCIFVCMYACMSCKIQTTSFPFTCMYTHTHTHTHTHISTGCVHTQPEYCYVFRISAYL
jgi:hypothetical protein